MYICRQCVRLWAPPSRCTRTACGASATTHRVAPPSGARADARERGHGRAAAAAAGEKCEKWRALLYPVI